MSQQDQPIPSVPGSGSADATQYTQTNSVRIFNEFIEANKGRYPYGAWDRMKAQDFCDRQLWEDFAGFLCETYTSPSGKNANQLLGMNSALGVFGALIQKAKNTHERSDAGAKARTEHARAEHARTEHTHKERAARLGTSAPRCQRASVSVARASVSAAGAPSLFLGCLGCSAVDRFLWFGIESAGCGPLRVPACPVRSSHARGLVVQA